MQSLPKLEAKWSSSGCEASNTSVLVETGVQSSTVVLSRVGQLLLDTWYRSRKAKCPFGGYFFFSTLSLLNTVVFDHEVFKIISYGLWQLHCQAGHAAWDTLQRARTANGIMCWSACWRLESRCSWMSRVGNPSHPLAAQTKLSSAVEVVCFIGNHEGIGDVRGTAE